MRSILVALAFAFSALVVTRGQPTGTDTILIVSMSPEKFEDGKETSVEVTIAYDLTSFDEAVIDIAANQLRPQSLGSIGNLRVKRGIGVVTVTGKFVPRYWTPSMPARISAHLAGGEDPLVNRRVLAHDETRIAVAKRPHPAESDPTNPNPADVYDDAVTITSVTPETFVEGEETEITVAVAYELLSREQGQINLGFNEGRGGGYRIIGSTLIKAGAGETVLKARVVPKRTGKLPFAKVFVNLSEYPHRPTWSPLADDSHTIEVR
ncbi:MAG TPA: hypothetical protein VFJ90_16445 [Candidatus Didemnitutus sp.]|nr:hypothetical protein [Candidatus Didemnitutus sp.]